MVITMNESRIISPQMEMRNKAAIIMAYYEGATNDEDAKEIAQHFKIIEIDNFIKELVRKEMK